MSQFKIPLSEPCLKGNEKKYVTQAIDSQWVSVTGPFVGEFRKKVEEYVDAKNAIPMQNATAALHMAMILMGINPGDAVIVPTLTFIASVNCVKHVGAVPIFMDCDLYGSMDTNKLRQFCERECTFTENGLYCKETNQKVSAIVVTHVFGNMADMETIMQIADTYHLKVIEDAAQALGTYYTSGKYKGRFAGTIGDCGVFSYNSNKIITCGSGGTLVVKDDDLAKEAVYLSTQAKDDPLRYFHDKAGYNYLMNNIQAAVGIAQMEQLEGFITSRKRNYALYAKFLEGVKGLKLLPFNPNCRPNYWFYSLKVDPEFGISRDQLMDKLMEQKIQTRPVWGLVHRQKPYVHNMAYNIEVALDYSSSVLNIPCSSSMTGDEVEQVVQAIINSKK